MMIIVYWYDMIPIKIIIAFLDKSFHVKQVLKIKRFDTPARASET